MTHPLVLLALLGPGPSVPLPKPMIASIVATVEEAVCDPPTRFGEGCGPLLVDMESFRAGLKPADPHVGEDQIGRGIGRPFKDVRTRVAYACVPPDPEFPCMFRHHAVHLRLEWARLRGEGADVAVTFSWDADHIGPHRHHSGVSTIWYKLSRRSRWKPVRMIVLMAT